MEVAAREAVKWQNDTARKSLNLPVVDGLRLDAMQEACSLWREALDDQRRRHS
jgi:hypothetical protein